MDMSKTIIPSSLQLNADDLTAGPMTITVTKVVANEGSAEQPVKIYFEGDGGRPFMPCKTTRRVLVSCWGKDAANYTGRSMTLYRDPEVTWGGLKVGGIRISHMSHIEREQTLVLTASKTNRRPCVIKPLKVAAQSRMPQDERRPSPAQADGQDENRASASPSEAGGDDFGDFMVKPHNADGKELAPRTIPQAEAWLSKAPANLIPDLIEANRHWIDGLPEVRRKAIEALGEGSLV